METPPSRHAEFTKEPFLIEKYWKIRKGLFPAVGAVRPVGTTVIIEDVAVPIASLAAATADLQAALLKHGYREAIIFGHALDGNLHFVFAQGFADGEAIRRYAALMDDVAEIIVGRYDGSLKAEHGTGRNMAPFVEMEWGRQATELMWRIKRLFDPEGLLNPGVILNADPDIHLKNFKPMLAADPTVDRCIECGFCEPMCPTRGLTVTPRQRIAGARELARLSASQPGKAETGQFERDFLSFSVDSCAACGMCETACPVGINTGTMSKAIRGRHQGAIVQSVARFTGGHYGAAFGARLRQPPGGHPVRSRYGRSWARRFGGAIARFDGAQGSACLSPWNAQGRHGGEKPRKRPGRRKTSRGLFRKLRRANVRIRTGRQGWRAATGHAPKPCSEGRPLTHRPAAPSGALLRPALRFQGPGRRGRPQSRGGHRRSASGERGWQVACFQRYQPVLTAFEDGCRRTIAAPRYS